uniref:Uncharacterized protein n=1 Tax=Caenorhabditis japonica TaxID=281687 RepID=A0A8R1EI47_CAEJA
MQSYMSWGRKKNHSLPFSAIQSPVRLACMHSHLFMSNSNSKSRHDMSFLSRHPNFGVILSAFLCTIYAREE